MKKRDLAVRLIPAAVVCAVTGCRTTKEVLDDYEANVMSGNYSAPIPEVTELAEKGDDSQQLWRLLSGAANYMADDKPAALHQFDAAEEVFKKNDLTSVFAQTGDATLAMLTNDRAFPYDGGGQDRVFTCLYKAVDFMSMGKFDAARVELNRSSQYQSNWLYDRRKDIDAAARKLETDAASYQTKQGVAGATSAQNRSSQTSAVLSDADFAGKIRQQCGFDPATSGDLSRMAAADYMNAYAMHVTGVFRWLNGDSDRNELRDAMRLAGRNAVVAKDYAERDRNVRPDGCVWIWAEDGLCPVREEWRIDLPLALLPYVNNYVIYAGMALPYLRARGPGAASWNVTGGGISEPMRELADVDALVKSEYDVYMRGALTREITRTIVKVGVQAALGAAAAAAEKRARMKGEFPTAAMALRLSQIGVATWAASTTAADLRSWTALPKSVKVARVPRPADGRLTVTADGQRIELALPPGNAMVFIRKPSPAAPPVVKTAVFAR